MHFFLSIKKNHIGRFIYLPILITAMTDEFWKIQSPIGFSTVLLDQRMYSLLSNDSAKEGLRLEGVPIQVRSMKMLSS